MLIQLGNTKEQEILRKQILLSERGELWGI